MRCARPARGPGQQGSKDVRESTAQNDRRIDDEKLGFLFVREKIITAITIGQGYMGIS